MEIFAAVSVSSFGKHNDYAAFFYRGFTGSHTFYRLINILIQRISAVSGNNNVSRNRVYLTLGSQEFTSNSVSQIAVAGNSKNGIVGSINNNINDKVQSGSPCRIQHVIVNRIAFNHSSAGMRIGNKARVVVVHNGFTACNAGKHTLSSAREAGKEVRLNKSLCHRRSALQQGG